MRLEGTPVNTVNIANIAYALNGFDVDLTDQQYKSIRVKADQTGFELTRKAQIVTVNTGATYVIGSVDVDAFLVVSAAGAIRVAADLAPTPGLNVALYNNTGDVLTVEAGAGVTLISPPDYTADISDGGVVQLKEIAANTWVIFGNLEAA